MSNGKRCSAAMGTDEGDICEFCQNRTETYQQQKDSLEYEKGSNSNQTIRKDNSPSPNPAAPQPITNFKTIKFENKENVSKNNLTKPNSNWETAPAKNDNQTLIINLKSIKKITLNANNLVIEFKATNNNKPILQDITAEQINNNQELQDIKNYCQKNNKTSLNQQELNSLINPNSTSFTKETETKKNNLPLLIGGGVVVLALVGLAVVLVIKKTAKIKKQN